MASFLSNFFAVIIICSNMHHCQTAKFLQQIDVMLLLFFILLKDCLGVRIEFVFRFDGCSLHLFEPFLILRLCISVFSFIITSLFSVTLFLFQLENLELFLLLLVSYLDVFSELYLRMKSLSLGFLVSEGFELLYRHAKDSVCIDALLEVQLFLRQRGPAFALFVSALGLSAIDKLWIIISLCLRLQSILL